MEHASILGVGAVVPENTLTNADLIEFSKEKGLYVGCRDIGTRGRALDLTVESGNSERYEDTIHQRTGILQRPIAPEGVEVYHLAIEAAKNAIAHSGVDVLYIRRVYVATASSHQRFPSAASRVAGVLRLPSEIVCKDIGAACSGYISALDEADAAVKRDGGLALVIAAEKMNSMVDKGEFSEHPDSALTLFSDGAGAAVIGSPSYQRERSLDVRICGFYEKNIPEGADKIYQDVHHFIRMPEGRPVFKLATTEMPNAAYEAAKRAWGSKHIDYLIPHQANGRIISSIIEKNGFSEDIVYNNVARLANMSCATVAVALVDAWNNIFPAMLAKKDSIKVVIAAFGSGYIANAVALEVRKAA